MLGPPPSLREGIVTYKKPFWVALCSTARCTTDACVRRVTHEGMCLPFCETLETKGFGEWESEIGIPKLIAKANLDRICRANWCEVRLMAGWLD